MGITEKGLVTEKVAIWEGMYTADQSGDSAGVTILYSAYSRRFCRIVAD